MTLQTPEADVHMTQLLAQGAVSMGLHLKSSVRAGCVAHWRMVQAYNQRTNLTSIDNDRDAALLHYLDSLSAVSLLEDGPIVDFGSGAGFPGIPLALARPDLAFELIEPRRKRVSFLRYAVATLGLTNVRVREARLEDASTQLFGQAVTRATFSDTNALLAVQRWLVPGGTLLVWRSSQSSESASGAAYTLSRHTYCLGPVTRHIEQWIWPPAEA